MIVNICIYNIFIIYILTLKIRKKSMLEKSRDYRIHINNK